VTGSAWWQVSDGRKPANRLGFVVDVVGYEQRTTSEQELVQHRLQALLRAVVNDVGDDFDEADRDSGAGDGLVVLPAGAGDPTERLPALLRSVKTRLAEDNAAAEDRIRLRMAVGTGQVAGFAGPLVVNISRLVDSEPLRRAVAGHPEADLVVLVLDVLRHEVVAPCYVPLVADCVALVDVAMKEFVDEAWLLASRPQG
jgi:hypothetical protein